MTPSTVPLFPFQPQEQMLPALKELLPGQRWVVHDEKKIPYTPRSGTRARINDPNAFAFFERARFVLEKNLSRYSGLGRGMQPEDGLSGVDLDHCLDEDGMLSAYAHFVVSLLNSYTETTPSGQGIRIWVKATIPQDIGAAPELDGACRIEMKHHKGYFTVTGKHLAGTPTTIEARQNELNEVYELTLKRREAARHTKRNKATEPSQRSAASHERTYGRKALTDECNELATTSTGGRHIQLTRAAFRMGQLVAGSQLERAEAEQRLYQACSQNGLVASDGEAKVKRTLQDCLEAGMEHPRKPSAMSLPRYEPSEALLSGNGTKQPPGADGNPSYRNGIGQPSQGPEDLPVICIGGQLRDVRDAALSALLRAEQTKGSIFVHAGQLVELWFDENQRPLLRILGVAELKNALTRAANFYRVKEKGGEGFLVAVSPPKEIAEAILALSPDAWRFPTLERISELPILHPDGSLMDTPGYDAQTHLYYCPHPDLTVPAIPTQPTQAEIEQAVAFLQGFIADFPFVSRADKANAFGLLVTTVIRHLVRHVPLALITSTKAGTGKGLLTDCVAMIATGQSAASLSHVQEDAEWDKRITALLLSGQTLISIDNVEGILRSPILSKALTMDYHTGRVLGSSKMVCAPQRAVWIANGNNVQLGGDIPRRCYPIAMAVQVSDPWARPAEAFRYPQLLKAIQAQRGAILAALLTLVRGWCAAGQPRPKQQLTRLATFSEWVDLVGGVLSYAGIEGFLENLKEMHTSADSEGTAWANFYEMWLEKLGTHAYTTSEVIGALQADQDFADTLPEPLGSWYQEESKSLSRKLGQAFAKKNGTPFGPKNLRIVQGENTDKKIATFRVTGGPPSDPPPSTPLLPDAPPAQTDMTPESTVKTQSFATVLPSEDTGYTGYTGFQTASAHSEFVAVSRAQETPPAKNENEHDAEQTPYTPYTPYHPAEQQDVSLLAPSQTWLAPAETNRSGEPAASADTAGEARKEDLKEARNLYDFFLEQVVPGNATLAWTLPDSPFVQEIVPTAEYCHRIRFCLKSQEASLRAHALSDLQDKITAGIHAQNAQEESPGKKVRRVL